MDGLIELENVVECSWKEVVTVNFFDFLVCFHIWFLSLIFVFVFDF